MSQYVLKSASTGLGQAFPYHRSSEKKEASVDSRRDREEHMSKRLELRFKRWRGLGQADKPRGILISDWTSTYPFNKYVFKD